MPTACPNTITAPGFNYLKRCEFTAAELQSVLAERAVTMIQQALLQSSTCPNMISARTLNAAQGVILNATIHDQAFHNEVLPLLTNVRSTTTSP